MKRIILLIAFLSATLTNAYISASEWVGEPVTSGTTYYIYDVLNTNVNKGSIYNKFLTHDLFDGDNYPAWGDYESADQFTVTITQTLFGNEKYYQIFNTRLQKYLYSNGIDLQAYSSKSRDFDHKVTTGSFEVTIDEAKITRYGSRYKLFFKFGASYYYLHKQTDAVGEKGFRLVSFISKIGENLEDHQWAFISTKQYEMRPKLDEKIAEINRYQWAEGTKMSQALSDYLTAAAEAQIATSNVGDALSAAFSNLSYQFDIDKGIDADLVAARKKLHELIDSSLDVQSKWTANLGYIPTDLSDAISEANTALKTNNTTADVNAAYTTLANKIALYTKATVLYCGEMKQLSEKMGYPFPDSRKQELLNLVSEGADAATINTFTKLVQDEFKAWVTARITAGTGFPQESDFSAYILNNSFEMGTTQNWTETAVEANSDKDDNGVTYYNYQGSANLSQTVAGLPAGNYSLSSGLNQGATIQVIIDGTPVTDISNFNVPAGKDIVISISGTDYTIDNLKLTLLGGAASTYSFSETVGVGADTPTGIFSTVTVNRTFTPSTNWNTFCSPCNVDAATKNTLFSSVYFLSGADYVILNPEDEIHTAEFKLLYTKIEENEALQAGVTYLVKVKDSFTSYSVTDAMVVKEPNTEAHYSEGEAAQVMMLGTFQPYAKGEIPCISGYDETYNYYTYILQNNEFRRLADGNKIAMKAFRGYFFMNRKIAHAQAAEMRISFEFEENTAIEVLSETPVVSDFYSLQGVLVTEPTAGIYIKGGKKYLIKQ